MAPSVFIEQTSRRPAPIRLGDTLPERPLRSVNKKKILGNVSKCNRKGRELEKLCTGVYNKLLTKDMEKLSYNTIISEVK